MLSIVIPTYGMHGQGTFFLERCVQSIAKQIHLGTISLEIILADQSKDFAIQDWASQNQSIGSTKIPLHYYRVQTKLGFAAHNLNVGISHARYAYCKILFQDDVLVEDNYLARILEFLSTEAPQCLFTGALHTTNGVDFTDPIVPSANPYFLFGMNTVSSPSVLTIARAFALEHPFDEHLKMLFDCAFYYAVFASKTRVAFAPEIHIANGIWQGQAQHAISSWQFTKEVRHLHRSYPQAALTDLLPNYQAVFAARHPNAPFPFSQDLEPNFLTRIREWWIERLGRKPT
jgi:hypothetical protein